MPTEISYKEQMEKNGFVILPQVVKTETISQVIVALENLTESEHASEKEGELFALRNLFEVLPIAKEIALGADFLQIVERFLGENARLVRGLFFDKTPAANWSLRWHQDKTIAVRERHKVPGYTPFTQKAGVLHVQPPAEILDRMLTLRLFLDSADLTNGALEVLQGSHCSGKKTDTQIEREIEVGTPFVCAGKRGDLLLMKPLLLHRSASAQRAGHRRVLHFDYANTRLEGELEWLYP